MGKILLLVAAVLLGVLAFLFITGGDGDSSPDAYDTSLDDLRDDDEPLGPLLEAAPAPIRRPNEGASGTPTA